MKGWPRPTAGVPPAPLRRLHNARNTNALPTALRTQTVAPTLDPSLLLTDPGGSVRVGGTRVTLDSIVSCFDEGATAEEVALRFPTLKLGDIYSTISYVLQYRDEVDAYLADRRRIADEVRGEAERRWPTAGLREKLLARRSR